MTQKMQFVILKTDPAHKTMLINWGQEKRWYRIPKKILDNPDLSQDEVMEIIEKLRPVPSKPITISKGMQSLIDVTDQELSQQYADNEVLL